MSNNGSSQEQTFFLTCSSAVDNQTSVSYSNAVTLSTAFLIAFSSPVAVVGNALILAAIWIETSQNFGQPAIDLAKYKKSVVSILYILLLFSLFLAFCCFNCDFSFLGRQSRIRCRLWCVYGAFMFAFRT